MGLDIFFGEDIRNALLAADEASSSTARVCAAVGREPLTLRAYLEGYRAALTTLPLAFGLSPAIIAGRSPSTSSGQGETLEVQARTVGEALPVRRESDTPSTLTDDERALVCYALEHLGGKFNTSATWPRHSRGASASGGSSNCPGRGRHVAGSWLDRHGPMARPSPMNSGS